jgi:hypothetical protein
VLCDRVPEDGEEWFFKPESAVGFVLNSQLCAYLEKTCQQLALFNMPVHDYHWLRSSLFDLRRLDADGYSRDVTAPKFHEEGTMRWLRAVDRAVSARIATRLRDAVTTPPGERESARRVNVLRSAAQEQALSVLWGLFKNGIAQLADALETDREGRRFRLERLAARIDEVRKLLADQLEGDPAWKGAKHKELRQNLRNAVRERIVRAVRLPAALSEAAASGLLIAQLKSLELSAEAEGSKAELAKRLSDAKKMSDSDIDVLLSLAHVVSLGYEGRGGLEPISHLVEPNWYSQVFIDEFQDFTEVQLFLMGAQADPDWRTVTVVGDYRQRLRKGGPVDVAASFPWAESHQTIPGVLLENKRQTAHLAELSQRFRELILGDPPIADIAFGQQGEKPRLLDVDEDAIPDAIYDEVSQLSRAHSIAVICPSEVLAQRWERAVRDALGSDFRQTRVSTHNDLLAKFYVHFTTPLEAKGLEFDATIVAGLHLFSLAQEEDANGCYVAVSRPRKRIALVGDVRKLDARWSPLLSLMSGS